MPAHSCEDTGRIERQEPTIHDDDAFAKSQGLPGIIADGMISTNWIMGMLIDNFVTPSPAGARCARSMSSRSTKMNSIVSRARITDVTHGTGSAVTYRLDVWCENGKGETVTVATQP